MQQSGVQASCSLGGKKPFKCLLVLQQRMLLSLFPDGRAEEKAVGGTISVLEGGRRPVGAPLAIGVGQQHGPDSGGEAVLGQSGLMLLQ